MRAGGAERVFLNLLSLWDPADELHLVLLRREGPLLDQVPSDVVIHELGAARFWLAVPRLIALIRTLAPDALLSTQAHVNAAVGLLRPWWGVRRVAGRETNMPRQVDQVKKTPRWRQWLYRWGYQGLDTVVCLSHAMADEVSQLYGVQDSVTVIPNPLRVGHVRSEAGQDLPPELAALREGRWLTAVGRFSEQKGFDLLLEALSFLPEDLRLCLIGDGSLRESLQSLARDLGVEDRVVFAGFQANPHRLVARSSLFVLSSRYEGQPNAALEALALGVPVVAFDGPWGAREVVIDGVTGCLTDSQLPRALGDAVMKALAVDWDRDRIRAWVEERFEGLAIAARYRQVLL